MKDGTMKDGLRNKLVVAFVVTALAGTLFLNLPFTQAATKSPVIFVYSMEANFQPEGHFNNYAETGYIGHAAVSMIDQLAPHVLGTTNFYPELATNWNFVGDWLVVKLRTGVTWHDGVPFNATDVWSTFILHKIRGYSEWGSNIIDDVQVVNASAVKFHVTGLHDLALNWLLSAYVNGPYHVYKTYVDAFIAHPDTADAISVDLNAFTPRSVAQGAIGTGPFMLSNMTESDLWLKKFTNFYAADKIVIDYIHGIKEPSNEVGWGYFFSNTADWGEPFAPVPVATVLNATGTKVFLAKQTRHDFVVFNFKNPLLAQKTFRQAFAYALNRTELVLSANYPVFHASQDIIPYSEFYIKNWLNTTFLSSLNKYEYDPDTAKSLFESIGLRYNDKDQLCFANGSVVTLYVKFPAPWTDVALMMANVATQLNRVGVTVIPLALDWATVDHAMNIGDFDLVWYTAGGDHPYQQGFDATSGYGFPTYGQFPKVITWQGTNFNLTKFFVDWGKATSVAAETPYVAKLAQIYNDYLFALPFSDTDTMFYGSGRFIYPPSYDTAWMCNEYARGIIVAQLLMPGKFQLNMTYWTVSTQPAAPTPIETYIAIGLAVVVAILLAYIFLVRKK
jgi:ABC-type transport system substrate-binding protein